MGKLFGGFQSSRPPPPQIWAPEIAQNHDYWGSMVSSGSRDTVLLFFNSRSWSKKVLQLEDND